MRDIPTYSVRQPGACPCVVRGRLLSLRTKMRFVSAAGVFCERLCALSVVFHSVTQVYQSVLCLR